MGISIAVAMSVYKSDNIDYLVKSIDSILNQTIPSTLFIHVDGFVPESINEVLKNYAILDNVYVFFNNENLGLATRLNQIIDTCVSDFEFDFLARMDADDISELNRFEKQVDFLSNHPEVSVVGSDIIEISEKGDEIFYKKMDEEHDLIFKNIIKKCPFNHPSVMFKMSIFYNGFRYKSELMNTQDYYLWVDLLASGARFANLNEPLLKFRVDSHFHTRRGFKKAINDTKSRLYAFRKLKVLTVSNVLHVINLFVLRVSPTFLKKWAYNNLR